MLFGCAVWRGHLGLLIGNLLPLHLPAQQGVHQALRVQLLGFEDGFALLLQAQWGEPAQGVALTQS